MIHEWHAANGSAATDHLGSVFKNMHQVRAFAGVHADTPVVAIDDRPDNILHGEVCVSALPYLVRVTLNRRRVSSCPQAVRVAPYTVAVNLVEVARLFVPEWNAVLEQRYGHTLQESWRTYQRNPARYTVAWMDVAMSQSAAIIRSKIAALGSTPMSKSIDSISVSSVGTGSTVSLPSTKCDESDSDVKMGDEAL